MFFTGQKCDFISDNFGYISATMFSFIIISFNSSFNTNQITFTTIFAGAFSNTLPKFTIYKITLQDLEDANKEGEEYDLKGLEKCDKTKTFANITIDYQDGTAKKAQVELKC